jgi:CubicO group peptidase (beta-lactamase class C family)
VALRRIAVWEKIWTVGLVSHRAGPSRAGVTTLDLRTEPPAVGIVEQAQMGTTPGRIEVGEGPRLLPRRPGPRSLDAESGESDLTAWSREVLGRHPAVGLAVGVLGAGTPCEFVTWGFADRSTGRPVDADTAFRIGSVTKVITAIAVMQLQEQGALDLDGPAQDYLRGYRLVPARASIESPSVRHLLTHTAGIAEVQRVRDLAQRGAGPFGSRPSMPSGPPGAALPSLPEYYCHGLPVVATPGTTFAYSNHGYATLGRIVEEVSGVGLDRYFRERIFDPLGMKDSGLGRPTRAGPRLATGYVIGRHGVTEVPDRDWLGAGSGGVFATPRDLCRLASAIIAGGGNEHGSVLAPETLATMFEPHHQPDPRVPGWGLGFARSEVGGHRVVGHDGVLPGFNSAILVAPDDELAVIALTNGAPGAFVWFDTELRDLVRHRLRVPAEEIRHDVPQHPELWNELRGTYRLPPRVSDLRGRVALAGGVQVLIRSGRLVLRALAPVPALYRGVVLHPDDPEDPYAFRVDLSALGMASVRIVFGRDATSGALALHADPGGQPLSLVRREGRRRG